MHPEGNAGRRKAGTALCFGHSGLGISGRAAWAHPPPQDKFGRFSPGFRSPSYWLRTPNFIWQCVNIHRPPVKITRGSWLKDTVISSVERHLVVKTTPANALDTGLVPGLGGYHVSRSNKPVQHKYWACALKLVFCNKSSCSNEKPAHSN